MLFKRMGIIFGEVKLSGPERKLTPTPSIRGKNCGVTIWKLYFPV
jgi:hypothetical protein